MSSIVFFVGQKNRKNPLIFSRTNNLNFPSLKAQFCPLVLKSKGLVYTYPHAAWPVQRRRQTGFSKS